MAQLTLGLLGPLQFALDGAPLTGFESEKVRALLIYLAVEGQHAQRRGVLAALLWPERPERAALLNLNQALANLRKLLGDRNAAVPFVLATRDTLQLNAAADWNVDLRAFKRLLAECVTHTHRSMDACALCAERLEQATALYRGGFSEQFTLRNNSAFEEWLLVWRERLQRDAVAAFAQLASYYERGGNLGPATRAAQRHSELDPWDEGAHRQLMRLLAADGQRGSALAHYARLRDTLAAELGILPEEETHALYEQIRAEEQHGGEAADAPIAPASRLPAPPTPFVGRGAELAQLGERLSDPHTRLITLVGLGGSGKTRLALEAAGRYAAAFTQGAHFVSLAALSSPEPLIPVLAQSLGLAAGASQSLATLLAALRGYELLLVLDNLEQLRDGMELLSALLEGVPGLTILATSRRRLGLRGEWALELEGLDLPTGHTPEALEQSGASLLFIQAARRAGGNFAPDVGERRAISRICRLLAGHPLAIELAAGWTQLLACGEIERELVQSLNLLSSPAQQLPEGQRTLRAVLDAAWGLLNPAEQRALQRLSCLRGSFDRAAATALLENQPGSATLLPLLAALAARALLRRTPGGRYELHEFVRQYAEEHLIASGEADELWQLHGAHYLALVEAAEPQLRGAEQASWMERLAREQDNLRAALERALARGAVEQAGRMCVVLRWFWYLRGNTGEGLRWLQQVLATPEQLPPQLLARLQHGAGVLAEEQADYRAAAAHYDAAITLFRALDDAPGVRITTNSLGVLSMALGRYAEAQRCFEESLRLSRALNAELGIANSLNNLGHAALAQGRSDEALVFLAEALERARLLQHDLLINTVLGNMGDAARATGDAERAVAAYSEALAMQRASGYHKGAALSLCGLGAIALAQGDLASAASQLFEALGYAWPDSNPREVLAIAEEIAALRAAEGAYAEAAHLAGATSALRERLQAPRLLHEQQWFEHTLTVARAALAATAFARAYAAGRAASLEEIATALLEQGENATTEGRGLGAE